MITWELSGQIWRNGAPVILRPVWVFAQGLERGGGSSARSSFG
jgi:hypothetical protein